MQSAVQIFVNGAGGWEYGCLVARKWDRACGTGASIVFGSYFLQSRPQLDVGNRRK